MSNEAITWAFKQELPMNEKFILVALADYADDEHSCFPSHSKTAARVGASVPTVKRCIAKLADRGLITIERRLRENGSHSANRYVLAVGGSVQSEPPPPPVQNDPPVQSDTHPRYSDEPGVGSPVTPPEPSINPHLNPHSSSAHSCRDDDALPGMPAHLPKPVGPTARDLIGEWIDHRRASTGTDPTKRTIGILSREIKTLLDEGQPYADVRAGLQLWDSKGLGPSLLASCVDQARAPVAPSPRQAREEQIYARHLELAAAGVPNPFMTEEDRRRAR